MGLRTFLVEDNARIRENLAGTLEELVGAQVIGFAETEQDGIRWLTEHASDWDLAIVDLFLQDGSGLGVASACQRRGPQQKLIVLTNYATSDIRKRCSGLAVDAVFDKSNEIDKLMDFCTGCAQPTRPQLNRSSGS